MILWGEKVWIWDRNCNFSQKKKRSMLYQSSNSTLMGTNLFVFLRESPIWSVNQKAQIWAVTRKSSDYSYFIYALEWNKRNDNTTVRTYRKHRIMLSLIMTYFHLNQKDSWNCTHTVLPLLIFLVSQLKEIEDSHLLKSSTCKLLKIYLLSQLIVNQDLPKSTKFLISSNLKSVTSMKLLEGSLKWGDYIKFTHLIQSKSKHGKYKSPEKVKDRVLKISIYNLIEVLWNYYQEFKSTLPQNSRIKSQHCLKFQI